MRREASATRADVSRGLNGAFVAARWLVVIPPSHTTPTLAGESLNFALSVAALDN